MKRRYAFLLFFTLTITGSSAQQFTGYVKKQDTIITNAYLAKIEISEAGKVIDTLKSYFDGSYHYTTEKNHRYSFRISFPGYTDTTFQVTTDKEGAPTPARVTAVLHKDGMRLLGIIKSKEEDFPIKGATIVVKNIMTRKEERVTTDIDGYYNVRLEYETNYRVSIDERSPGIINRYEDTVFYLSTIGFNQPLDYRLDIALGPNRRYIKPRESYHPVTADSSKPVVDVAAIVNGHQPPSTEPTERDTTGRLTDRDEAAKPAPAPATGSQPRTHARENNPKKPTKIKASKKKKEEETIEVVIIRDDAPADTGTKKSSGKKRK